MLAVLRIGMGLCGQLRSLTGSTLSTGKTVLSPKKIRASATLIEAVPWTSASLNQLARTRLTVPDDPLQRLCAISSMAIPILFSQSVASPPTATCYKHGQDDPYMTNDKISTRS